MTIIYQYRVATTSLGGFLKLLRAWKGSVYKLLFRELFIFLILYACISLVYRLSLSPSQKTDFESLVLQLHHVTSSMPLSFVLGFYVSVIVHRWWQQFSNVPWPDRTLFVMSSYLHGSDDKARMMRRGVARYMLFSFILITRAVSVAVMKRFPTLEHIVEAGFITKEESEMYETTTCQYLKFWVPLMWANNLLVTARREGRIDNEFGLRMVLECYQMIILVSLLLFHWTNCQQLAGFRDKCSLCFVYDWITVPLVYTQVVTLAVYSYFAASLIGQQYLDPSKQYDGFDRDFYLPGFTILQFLFYMGWLKVAEQMINPFGEDDDDYDINWLLDRHTAVAFALVDQCYGRHPPLSRDPFWNDVEPDVPYTEASLNSVRPNFLGSTFNVARPSIDVERMLVPDHEELLHPQLLALRQRSKSSFSGSLLSLFPFRHLRSHSHGDSHDTLASAGSGHGRGMSIPNGKTRYHAIPCKTLDGDGNNGLSSSDLHRRDRANTDCQMTDPSDRKRKLSLPFALGLNNNATHAKKVEVDKSSSPKPTRFTVEPVKDDMAMESCATAGNGAKPRRTGHSNLTFQNPDKVSRLPILSAIEEGNTITSLRQIATTTSLISDGSIDSHDNNDNNNIDDSNTNNNNDDNDRDYDDGRQRPLADTTTTMADTARQGDGCLPIQEHHTGLDLRGHHEDNAIKGKRRGGGKTDDFHNDDDEDDDDVFTFECPDIDLDLDFGLGMSTAMTEDEENLL